MEVAGNDVTIATVIARPTEDGNPSAFGLTTKDVFDKMGNAPAGIFH
jgi:hypothetical protein